MGVISPVGNDVKHSGIVLSTAFAVSTILRNSLPTTSRLESQEKSRISIRKNTEWTRLSAENRIFFTQYGVAAAYEAMQQAGLVSEGEGQNINPFRLGVYVGSGIGGFEIQYRETAKMIEDPSGQWISPLFIPTMISNIAAGHIAIKHHAQGPCIDVVTACATSTNNIGEAFRAIRNGYADAIIAGGCENATIPLGIAGFANAKALSRAENPKYASLPFNANRAGFVMGDGAGILVLEELEHAKARGAKIIAEIVGYGNTCDAYHATAPRPEGTTQAKCIELALEEAGFNKETDKMYINAHGTGTRLNDVAETKAYKLALGDYAYKAHIVPSSV